MDDILKDFGSTSPYHHNRVSLNAMAALHLARRRVALVSWVHKELLLRCVPFLRQEHDLNQAADNFWVPGLMQRGMLIRSNNKWMMCLGNTPAVMYATRPIIEDSRMTVLIPMKQCEVDAYMSHSADFQGLGFAGSEHFLQGTLAPAESRGRENCSDRR